jgi:hypothetical protein
VWQWDAQASERRELATKKAELAIAKKLNLSKCKPGNCQSYYLFCSNECCACMEVVLYFNSLSLSGSNVFPNSNKFYFNYLVA